MRVPGICPARGRRHAIICTRYYTVAQHRGAQHAGRLRDKLSFGRLRHTAVICDARCGYIELAGLCACVILVTYLLPLPGLSLSVCSVVSRCRWVQQNRAACSLTEFDCQIKCWETSTEGNRRSYIYAIIFKIHTLVRTCGIILEGKSTGHTFTAVV